MLLFTYIFFKESRSFTISMSKKYFFDGYLFNLNHVMSHVIMYDIFGFPLVSVIPDPLFTAHRVKSPLQILLRSFYIIAEKT